MIAGDGRQPDQPRDWEWLEQFTCSRKYVLKKVITIYFHILTQCNPIIGILRACRGISIKNINLREAAPTSSPNIAQSAWVHGTLWNAIFISLIGEEVDVIDKIRFNNDADFLHRLETALGMRPNHEYWCKCTLQTNGIIKTATSDRHDLRWQLGFMWRPRGIELVLKSVDCFNKRLFHSAAILLLLHMYLLFETSPGWLPGGRFFFLPRFGGGALSSSNVYTTCVVYWSLGCRRVANMSWRTWVVVKQTQSNLGRRGYSAFQTSLLSLWWCPREMGSWNSLVHVNTLKPRQNGRHLQMHFHEWKYLNYD